MIDEYFYCLKYFFNLRSCDVKCMHKLYYISHCVQIQISTQCEFPLPIILLTSNVFVQFWAKQSHSKNIFFSISSYFSNITTIEYISCFCSVNSKVLYILSLTHLLKGYQIYFYIISPHFCLAHLHILKFLLFT